MNHPKLRRWTLGAGYTIFSPFPLFVSVYVYASVWDFVCIASLSPFVLGFSLSVFVFLKKFFFLIIIVYFNNLFYFILLYFILSSFFLSFYFFSHLFWAMWMKGSWFSSKASGLCLWGGRANFRTLVHKRPPSSTLYQMVKISQRSPSQHQDPASFNDQQAKVLDTLCQTTSKRGTQPHPLAERLPKIIIRQQTPQNTPPDMDVPTRKTRSSHIHQNTGTSPLHQEAYRTHWKIFRHWGQIPKTTGTTDLQPVKRRTQTQLDTQNEKTEKHTADEGAR